tara:strand:+ start:201 stop:476 length:276 start_codon:yes stop_codon:yes gene_type:complete
MTLRDYINIEKIVHKKNIPAIILLQMSMDTPDEKFMYYSKSQERLVSIFDMQIHHLVYAFANINEQKHSFNVKSNVDERIAKIKNILEEVS